MKRYKAAIVNAAQGQVNYVYSPEQLQEISEITELRKGTAGVEEIENGSLRDVEVIFST